MSNVVSFEEYKRRKQEEAVLLSAIELTSMIISGNSLEEILASIRKTNGGVDKILAGKNKDILPMLTPRQRFGVLENPFNDVLLSRPRKMFIELNEHQEDEPKK